MTRLPTDLDMLNAIYERYYGTFASFTKAKPSRSAKIFVPIDIDALARDLGVDGDIVFGRLYYHLENRYRYKNDDGSLVHFFALKVGNDGHCINFTYAASVLASLRDENRKYRTATLIAIISLVVAAVSLVISIVW
ncbi:MAG: hypothetical protein WDZ59_12875 [Pirellulales bacterium]